MKPSEAAVEAAARATYDAGRDDGGLSETGFRPAWEDVDEKYKPAWRSQVEPIVAAAAPVLAAATLRDAAAGCPDDKVSAWLEMLAEDIEVGP